MAAIKGIHHVCIETWDIEESIAYYCDILGFSMAGREHCSFGEYAMVRCGDARIELIQREPARKNEKRPEGPIAHIGLEVDDVEALFNSLREKGVVFKTEEVERNDEPFGGIIACSTVGPCGEVINFYHFLREI